MEKINERREGANTSAKDRSRGGGGDTKLRMRGLGKRDWHGIRDWEKGRKRGKPTTDHRENSRRNTDRINGVWQLLRG